MKKKIIIFSLIVVGVAAIGGSLWYFLGGKQTKGKKINPAFAQYISAYTSGIISSQSTIKIRLANDFIKPEEVNSQVDENLFDFSPSIKGTAIWMDTRTIEFKPTEKLDNGQYYEAEFKLGKILKVPSDLKTFEFDFQVIPQSYSVSIDNVKPVDNPEVNLVSVYGTLLTADYADNELVEKVLSVSGVKQALKWQHDADGKTHIFQMDSIDRKNQSYTIGVSWSGNSIGTDTKGNDNIEIPAIDDFKFIKSKVVYTPEQFILLQFSDNIQEQQLEGIIKIANSYNNESLTFSIDGNEIRVYILDGVMGEKTVEIDESLKSIKGKSLPQSISTTVRLEELKPQVRLVGKGTILPNSNGLIFPFECVNLKAVDVKVIKIFENNIAQFLQVNDLDGNSELNRVGKVVLKKKVNLISKTPIDYAKWNRFFLELSELIKVEPGAIYKIVISFKKDYSLFQCADSKNAESEMESITTEASEDENSGEYGYDNYYYDDYYYYGDYNWRDRDNPCSSSYYTSSRSVSKNVLASDLGLIAKRGNDGSMVLAVTDLITTEPISGVTFELYDYQQQLLATAKSDGQGLATITEYKGKPFLLIAKNDKQRGYLKVADGNVLSISMFNVAGEEVQHGMKGFVYGERGVWRPGDSIYLTFILQDLQKKIPANYPITMELSNPQGQVIKKVVQSQNVGGFYKFATSTDANAPTGNWTAKIIAGGAVYSKTLKIETIVPNRLKINLDFGVDELSKANSTIAGTLKVKWLHGAIAKNLRANVAVSLSPTNTSFKNYENYDFDDPSKSFSSENITLFDGDIDENGEAIVRPNIQIGEAAPGKLNANFTVRVFEEGGSFSTDRFSMPYFPYVSYVGVLNPNYENPYEYLVTDTMHYIKIANLKANGKPVESNQLKVEVYKMDWRWWWDNSYENMSDYNSSYYNKPIQKKTISIANGKGEFPLLIKYPEWGRYLVRVTDELSGHSCGTVLYMDWPNYYSRSDRNNGTAATILNFTSDKNVYNVGDEVVLTIPASDKCKAFITVENGSKVLKTFWADLSKTKNTYSFKTTEEMTPNVYVSVELLQSHAQTQNDLPIRLYGYLPLMVENPNTKLNPVINLPSVLRPEEKATISVNESNGKPMTYTLAIVDEGLLDLTRFKTPDPWKYFYAKEALGVKTWDLFDFVMGAFGGKIESLLNIGGDDENKTSKDGAKANRFKPMVRFIGPFNLSKGSTNKHVVDIPQYVGSVRVMLIAANETAYGATEKTVPVRKPLMIIGTLPRVVGPNETVTLPIDIFAMEKNIRNVSVEIQPNAMFSVIGGSKKSITFNEVGDKMVNFELKVKPQTGIGKVSIVAYSGNEKAKYDFEIDVRNPNPKVVTIDEQIVQPNKTWTSTVTPIGTIGTNKTTIEVSSIPPIDMSKRIRYLMDYPHGCIEQTTSSVFPQLYLKDIMDLPKETQSRIDQNVKAAIKRIQLFQVSGGGFSYWPGNSEADDWGTNYAGHFLVEASLKGYSIPSSLLDSWKKYQKNKAKSWKQKKGLYYNDELVQAYRLYTLALAKSADLSAMNNLREKANLSPEAKWRLAAAYQLAGQPESAEKLIYSLPLESKKYREFSYTYGSSERDMALILETLCLLKQQKKAFEAMKLVSTSLSSNEWMSTQTTAYSLIAVSKYISVFSPSKECNFKYKVNGNAWININSKKTINQFELKINETSSNSISVTNSGSGSLYVRTITEGIPLNGDSIDATNDLDIKITYKTLKGEIIDPVTIEQGQDFLVEVKVNNPGLRGALREMALTQIFPSGWEILNYRMDNEAGPSGSQPKYQDIRDDRVYTYFDISANESKTFIIKLNASYLGKFYLPAVYCEAMYDNSVNARQHGKWVEVISSKK